MGVEAGSPVGNYLLSADPKFLLLRIAKVRVINLRNPEA